MKSRVHHIIEKAIMRNLKKNSGQNETDYAVAKKFRNLRISAFRSFKDIVLIIVGIISAGFGLKGFLLPNGFIDGGVTGISLLTEALTDYSLSILIVAINLPFIVLGYFQIGRAFVFKSICAILGLAVALALIEYPIITSDKLLVAVFGGFFLGAGIGLSMRGGSVLDGTEVLALFLSRKIGLSIGDLIFLFNILIFSTAAYLLSIEVAMYSILTYLAASKTVDFIIEGVEEYIGVTIISVHNDEIKQMIVEKMGKGVTIYNGKGGFGKGGEHKAHTNIIYSVITRLETSRFQSEVQKLDPNAFIVLSPVKDLKGGMIKKRQFKEK